VNWIKNKLRKWLGVESQESHIRRLEVLTRDLVSIGVDVHFKEPHMILIYSRLNGGQIREIRADFRDIRELQQFVEELRNRFNTRTVTYDRPRGMEHLKGW
jgi:hypothetical protein